MIMNTGKKISTMISVKTLVALVLVGLIGIPSYLLTVKKVESTEKILSQNNKDIGAEVIRKSITANAFEQGVSGEIEIGTADFVVMKVKFWQKNNLSRIETRNIDPFKGQLEQMITVSDGTTHWFYNKTENWGTKIDLTKLPENIRDEVEKSNSIYNFVVVYEEFAQIADVTEKTMGNKKYYVLTVNDLSPIKELSQEVTESPNFKKVLVWLDSDTYLISRIEM